MVELFLTSVALLRLRVKKKREFRIKKISRIVCMFSVVGRVAIDNRL